MVHLYFKCKIGDESGDEDEIGVENEATGSRKRDKKRQEREAQRQVILVSITHFFKKIIPHLSKGWLRLWLCAQNKCRN